MTLAQQIQTLQSRGLIIADTNKAEQALDAISAENGGYPPTQNGDIRSLFWLFSLMALQN